MDLLETDILGDSIGDHWYYASKAKFMRRTLGGYTPMEVLDVGAGSGFFSRYLLTETDTKSAVCVDPNYPEERTETIDGKLMDFRHGISGSGADLVLLMDVLEHVPDDVALLREYVDKVGSGTRFLVTVPAFRFMWSGHDDYLGHYRRYTVPQMRDVMEAAGLKVDNGCYCFGAVFPIAFAVRMAGNLLKRGAEPRSHMTKHGSTTNAVLKSLCAAETPFFQGNRIAGLSVLCVGHKE